MITRPRGAPTEGRNLMRHRPHLAPALVAAAVAAAGLLPAGAPCLAASQAAYAADLAAFYKQVDEVYPFFDLKGIRPDWEAAKRRLALGVRTCRSDSEFLGLVVQATRVLRDGHMGLENPKAEVPPLPTEYYPGIAFLPGIQNSVLVMYAPKELAAQLKTGTPVLTIDGKPARAYLDARAAQAWAEGGFFSSPQRARLFEYRMALRGAQGEKHVITYLDGRNTRRLALTSTLEARGWPHTYNMPPDPQRVGRSFFYARLPSGAGYMYMRSVDGDSAPGIREAVAKLSDARGWVVDLRGNGGGGYDESLINAVKEMPRPVAVLIDAGCISAGETLARDFRRYAEARLFGSKTAGSSTSKTHWAFPSGIATVRLSVRSRWRNDRQPIEFNGIDPDVPVEAVPDELVRGQNSAILRAEEYLASRRR
jgi:hypothetical protein